MNKHDFIEKCISRIQLSQLLGRNRTLISAVGVEPHVFMSAIDELIDMGYAINDSPVNGCISVRWCNI